MSHTGNPRHPDNPPSDPPAEPTGPIAKDSLANESVARGGGFSENENPQALGVKGYQSTLNNTDTSGAEVLPPAASGTIRDGDTTTKYPDAAAGQGFDGTHSLEGYRGGSGDPSVSQPTSGTSAASVPSNTGSRPYVEGAPNYIADTTRGVQSEGQLRPKGDNLVEGGDIPEGRPTYTGDVGGSKDPGRLAEKDFGQAGGDPSAGLGARDYGNVQKGGDATLYDSLNSRESA